MKKNIKIILYFLASLLIIFIFSQQFFQKSTKIRINEAELYAEVAETNRVRQKGLSGREDLKKHQAMLFIFNQSDFYSFWAKDMSFAIDIIWLDENKTIVYIEKGVGPESFPMTFYPNKESKYVIETRAGFCEKYNVEIGNIAVFNL